MATDPRFQTRLSDLPAPDATDRDVCRFVLSFPAYEWAGGTVSGLVDKLDLMFDEWAAPLDEADHHIEGLWRVRGHEIPRDEFVEYLRGWLFWEQRGCSSMADPSDEDVEIIYDSLRWGIDLLRTVLTEEGSSEVVPA